MNRSEWLRFAAFNHPERAAAVRRGHDRIILPAPFFLAALVAIGAEIVRLEDI